jgi:hypothetical protein
MTRFTGAFRRGRAPRSGGEMTAGGVAGGVGRYRSPSIAIWRSLLQVVVQVVVRYAGSRCATASRSSISSASVAFIFSRLKSLICRPWTICQSPLLQVTGNE